MEFLTCRLYANQFHFARLGIRAFLKHDISLSHLKNAAEIYREARQHCQLLVLSLSLTVFQATVFLSLLVFPVQ